MASLELDRLFDVKDKVVLITGGSRGIGKMIATGFVKNGARVYISSRSAKTCGETEAELNSLGPGRCVAIPAEIHKLDEVDRLVKELSAKESALHVLVNNAGTMWVQEIEDIPDSTWTKVLTLNLQRVFTLTQKCLPLLRAAAAVGRKDGQAFQDPARIINIGSIHGLYVPGVEAYAYSASKAGLHHLSRVFAGRLGPEGITSNTLACGAFGTKMIAKALEMRGESIRAEIPLGRIGTPEDVVGACIFLASRAGAFVNGATISVDGGNLIGVSTTHAKL